MAHRSASTQSHNPQSKPTPCADRGKHEAIKRSRERVLRILGFNDTELLVSAVINTEAFLKPWAAYRDNYLLNPRYNDEGFLVGGEKIDQLFDDITREARDRSRAQTNRLTSEDGEGRAHTVRLYSSLVHELSRKGEFYDFKSWNDILGIRHMCDELYVLVKHLRGEYVHGHGAFMDVIEQRYPCHWLTTTEEGPEELPGADSVSGKTVAEADTHGYQDEDTTKCEDSRGEGTYPKPNIYYEGFTEPESSSEEKTEMERSQLSASDERLYTEAIASHFPQPKGSPSGAMPDSRRVEKGNENKPAATQFSAPRRPRKVPMPFIVSDSESGESPANEVSTSGQHTNNQARRHVRMPFLVSSSDSEDVPEAAVSASGRHGEPQPRRHVRMPFLVSSSDSEGSREDKPSTPTDAIEHLPQEEDGPLPQNEPSPISDQQGPTPASSHRDSPDISRPKSRFADLIDSVPQPFVPTLDERHLYLELQETRVEFNLFSSDSE